MATVYRDYGYLNGSIESNNQFNTTKRGQVYLATHEGEKLLPFMNRSFISFSFDGKKIEDFNLIATITNNSLGRKGSASFNDITTSYDNLDGQQYWNTHYGANSLDLTLVSDGMDQRKLDDFLYWFSAGRTKELILAEHPNRAILARVAEPPTLDLLPFEEKIEVTISNYIYPTSTTLYKGTINLSFVMDSPHWYSKKNILGEKDGDRYIDYWDDVNGNRVEIFSSQDALKILYEDGIPLGSMIQKNMLLGQGEFANVEDNIISRVWEIIGLDPDTGADIGRGARVEADNAVAPYQMGMIAGAIISSDGKGIESLERNHKGFFYYAGTAPAPTIISFTLTPVVDGTGYIAVPANSYSKSQDNNPYDTFTVESRTKQELRFTTPNLYTSYNKVIYIFSTYINTSTNKSWEDIRQMLREEVRHPRVREWANYILDSVINSNTEASIKTDGMAQNLKTQMLQFLQDNGATPAIQPVTFSFNSETGEALGTFKYRLVNAPTILTEIEEDVGDMLRSNYIIIRDRNCPSETGAINGWTEDHPEYSHCIYHSASVPLSDVQILYKNMYL